MIYPTIVIPAKAGTQGNVETGKTTSWIPAFAGMTKRGEGKELPQ